MEPRTISRPGGARPTARGTRARRRGRWFGSLAALVVVGATGVACAPPAEPDWLKVQWARDAGGTNDPVTGAYTGAWQRFVTTGGTTTGPAPAANPIFETPPPFLLTSLATVTGPEFALPDGTARFPWNGYAGEDITVDPVQNGPAIDYVATHPGGTCTVHAGAPGTRLLSATPSPDGSKIAVTASNNDFFGALASWVEIRELTASGCPAVTRADYMRTFTPAPSGEAVGAAVTWSPGSGAIVFDLRVAAGGSAIARLDATSGSTPSFVLAATEGCEVPLGWSYEDRVLLNCYVRDSAGVIQQSKIMSIPLGAGVTHVVDTFTAGPGTLATAMVGHYGYYAPGTNTIVFNKAVPVVSEEGLVQPWLQIHTVYDLPLATSSPLQGSPPPLVWHEENTAGPFEPIAMTHVPNMEVVERWVR